MIRGFRRGGPESRRLVDQLRTPDISDMVVPLSQGPHNPEPDASWMSRRMWTGIVLLILAMAAILIVGYMTFSRYVDLVKGQ